MKFAPVTEGIVRTHARDIVGLQILASLVAVLWAICALRWL